MYTFGPLIAKNNRSGRLLGGAPITVTTLDGTRLDTYTVDGQPLTLVTNHEGYHGTFRADTDQRVILARPRGGDPLPLYAHEGIQDAAEAADTINTGRLSETALAATFLPKTDTGAAGLALLAAALPADAREALDITIDTSVGTRVMVGGVMIYGSTGWRALCRWQEGQVTEGTLPPGFEPSSTSISRPGGIFIMRQGGAVTLAIAEAITTLSPVTVPLPVGFRGNASPPYPAVPLSYRTTSGDYALSQAEVGANQVRLRLPVDALLAAQGTGGYGVTITWTTDLDWPDTLPGLPA